MEIAVDDYAYIGRPVVDGLLDASWIHRRKESVVPCSDTWVRRQTSLDFTLPLDNPSPANTFPGLLQDGFLVPLTLLPKVPPALIRFDVTDRDRKAVPLPTRRQNALASYAALLELAARIMRDDEEDPPPALPESVRSELLYISLCEPDQAVPVARSFASGSRPALPDGARELRRDAERDLHVWTSQLRCLPPNEADDDEDESAPVDDGEFRMALSEHTGFRRFLRLFARNSVVVVQLRALQSERTMARISYEQNIYKDAEPRALSLTQRLGWRPVPFVVTMPYVAARSFHFEFESPPHTEVNFAELLSVGPEPELDEGLRYDFEPVRGTKVHLYKSNALAMTDASAYLELKVMREIFPAGAFWASAAIAGVVSGFAVLADVIVRNATGATALLLLFPGIVAGLVSRAHGSVLVIRLLQLSRRVLIASSICAVAAAAALTVTPTGRDRAGRAVDATTLLYAYWGGLATVSIVAASILGIARLLPRPESDTGVAEVLVFRLECLTRGLRRWRRHVRQRRFRISIEPNAPGDVDALPVMDYDEYGIALVQDPRRWRRLRRARRLRVARHIGGRPLLKDEATPDQDRVPLAPGVSQALSELAEHLAQTATGRTRVLVLWGKEPQDLEPVSWDEFLQHISEGELRLGSMAVLERSPQGEPAANES
jgi:hypothetical protein